MTTPTTATPRIAVIGANPRSAALARALIQAGHPVTTVHPTEPMPSAKDLLVLLCAEDPAEADRVLGALAPLPSRGIVNLTSHTSEQARETAETVSTRGAGYLQGALMAHPEHVGVPDTLLVYSGSHQVFQQHEAVLRDLGSATYLGEDAGVAPLYDVALLNLAWATLLGFLQTAALLGTADVQARTVAPLLVHWLRTTVSDVITDYADQIDDGSYPGDEEWLELDFPLMGHLLQATEAHGLDTGLPTLVHSLTSRGIAAGNGHASFASLIDIIRA